MKKLLTISFLVLLAIALMPRMAHAQDLENDSLALVALYNDCNVQAGVTTMPAG